MGLKGRGSTLWCSRSRVEIVADEIIAHTWEGVSTWRRLAASLIIEGSLGAEWLIHYAACRPGPA